MTKVSQNYDINVKLTKNRCDNYLGAFPHVVRQFGYHTNLGIVPNWVLRHITGRTHAGMGSVHIAIAYFTNTSVKCSYNIQVRRSLHPSFSSSCPPCGLNRNGPLQKSLFHRYRGQRYRFREHSPTGISWPCHTHAPHWTDPLQKKEYFLEFISPIQGSAAANSRGESVEPSPPIFHIGLVHITGRGSLFHWYRGQSFHIYRRDLFPTWIHLNLSHLWSTMEWTPFKEGSMSLFHWYRGQRFHI